MKLFYGPASPYVRKVMVTAFETKLDDRLALERLGLLNAAQPAPQLAAVNPLAKIPTLVLDDGRVIFGSQVICEYLDSLHEGEKLFPKEEDSRWRALARAAAGDGLLEAAMLARAEMARPDASQAQDWINGQLGKVRRCLDTFERDCSYPLVEPAEANLNIGDVAVACALGWLDFRMPDENWRRQRKRLADWFGVVSQRRSMMMTRPVAPPA